LAKISLRQAFFLCISFRNVTLSDGWGGRLAAKPPFFIQLRQKADIKLFDVPENIPLRPAYALPAPGQRKCRPKGDMCLFLQGRRMVFAKSKI